MDQELHQTQQTQLTITANNEQQNISEQRLLSNLYCRMTNYELLR